MKKINDLECGLAGEHLVCAELLMGGYRAFMTEQNCPYDIAVEIGGKLVRVQVKSTRAPKPLPQRKTHNPAYMWHVRRAGKAGARVYGDDEFDILALVALDSKKVAYLPPSKLRQTIHIRAGEDSGPPPNGGKSGKTFDMFPFDKAIAETGND